LNSGNAFIYHAKPPIKRQNQEFPCVSAPSRENDSSRQLAITTNIFSIFNNFQNPENVFAPPYASVKLEDPRWVAPTSALSPALPC
jgi:hypothetical protein